MPRILSNRRSLCGQMNGALEGRSFLTGPVVGLLLAATALSCAETERSPLGIPLLPRVPTREEEAQIARADRLLEADPRNVELLLEAALAREEVWRYREALRLYDRGIELAPEDYRLHLGRGHRLIRLRRLDEALAALDRAVELDPFGFNSAYLRGLTYYLMGDFGRSADEYGRCLSLARDPGSPEPEGFSAGQGDPRTCMLATTDARSRVSLTTWMYRALMRSGRCEEARTLLRDVPAEMDLQTPNEHYSGSTIQPGANRHYHLTLLHYRGLVSEERLLDRVEWADQWPTVAYGVAVRQLLKGDTASAVDLMKEVVSTAEWARLGHVASEVELLRFRDSGWDELRQ